MTTATASSTLSPERGRRSHVEIFVRYTLWDFFRTIRMVESSFFIVVLPTVLYVMFGALADYSSFEVGHGNVAAYQMVSMGVYGAVTATTSIAGTAATERQRGWGRQLGLTGLSRGGYMAGKVCVAMVLAALPLIVINIVAFSTGAKVDSIGIAVATALLSLLGALPFALYGLAAALMFRTEAAVSAASGLLVVMAFFGNLFMPLSDSLLNFARFTPLYGTSTLARWPLLEGAILSTSGAPTIEDPLWVPIASIVVWTLIFGMLCWWGSRRTTHRS